VSAYESEKENWLRNQSVARPVSEDRLHIELALLASQWLGTAVLRPADEPAPRSARSDLRESE